MEDVDESEWKMGLFKANIFPFLYICHLMSMKTKMLIIIYAVCINSYYINTLPVFGKFSDSKLEEKSFQAYQAHYNRTPKYKMFRSKTRSQFESN